MIAKEIVSFCLINLDRLKFSKSTKAGSLRCLYIFESPPQIFVAFE